MTNKKIDSTFAACERILPTAHVLKRHFDENLRLKMARRSNATKKRKQ